MLSERILDTAVLVKLQLAISRVGVYNAFLGLMAITAAIFVLDYVHMLYLRSKMPPGPFPLPIIGNTWSLPDNKPWIYFEELSKKLNTPLITFWIGRNPTVWINDAWCAHEIFEKKAQIYASRPRMIVFGELGTGQSNLVTMQIRNQQEREKWRIHRKLMHIGVGVQSVRGYRAIQNNESKIIALDFLREPKEYVKHLERYATSVVSIIAFGRRVASYNDPIITEVIALMQLAADLNVPGKSFPMLLETFPILAKFPRFMPWFKGLGQRAQKGGHYFFYTLAEEAIDQYDKKSPSEQASMPKPYVKTLFEEAEKYNLPINELSALTGNLFGAGADTSSSTLVSFILACCAFPDVVHKAHEELDRVIGPSRSPHWDDSPNLPYINAFVKEVLRWRSVAIIGGQPHSPTQDDTYKGYLIPRGSWVQGNVWAIHHHDREFPDPDRFYPDRYFEDNDHYRPFPNDKGYMTFGWGRRVCSGQALAEQGTWISVARLLWGFNIRKARDPKTGREIDVDVFAFTNGLNMRPQPFPCELVPRTEEIRETIEREGREALLELKVHDGESRYRMSTFYQEQKKKVKEEPVIDEKGNVKMAKV
ncbi:putative cytochrome P450 E-class, group I [Podospora fimiseda]|uniref:Cytochrome P450 E-class, group I n=1 Tax=Podospora fimiseda TaxID=252190 RepID=A0AAN6YRS8_9PEZI|nr:putative cytochrome P450 E-class, group I [Podospora fimiseda]